MIRLGLLWLLLSYLPRNYLSFTVAQLSIIYRRAIINHLPSRNFLSFTVAQLSIIYRRVFDCLVYLQIVFNVGNGMLPPEGGGEELRFQASVRSPNVQRVPLTNSTSQRWTLRPIVSTAFPLGLFSGKNIIFLPI